MDLYELSFDKALRKESGTPDRTARYSGLPRLEKVRSDGWWIVEVTRARVVPLSPQLPESSLRSMLRESWLFSAIASALGGDIPQHHHTPSRAFDVVTTFGESCERVDLGLLVTTWAVGVIRRNDNDVLVPCETYASNPCSPNVLFLPAPLGHPLHYPLARKSMSTEINPGIRPTVPQLVVAPNEKLNDHESPPTSVHTRLGGVEC